MTTDGSSTLKLNNSLIFFLARFALASLKMRLALLCLAQGARGEFSKFTRRSNNNSIQTGLGERQGGQCAER